jgi:hypothetical protein
MSRHGVGVGHSESHTALKPGMLVRDIGGNKKDGSVPTEKNVVETITAVHPASPSGGREFVKLALERVDTGTQRTKYLSKTKQVVAKAAAESANRKKTRGQWTLTGALTDYPSINHAGWRLIEEFAEKMDQPGAPELSDADRFDMFSHWLVAERKYPFPDKRYWKIAPGEEGWQGDECTEKGFIGVGWNDVGDVSGLSRAEFDALQDKMEAERGYKKVATNQVWTFAHDIQEGDVVVANRGTREILGFGTVVGPYEFVPDAPYAHQFPVRWDDTVPRRIDEKALSAAAGTLTTISRRGSIEERLKNFVMSNFEEAEELPQELRSLGLGPQLLTVLGELCSTDARILASILRTQEQAPWLEIALTSTKSATAEVIREVLTLIRDPNTDESKREKLFQWLCRVELIPSVLLGDTAIWR